MKNQIYNKIETLSKRKQYFSMIELLLTYIELNDTQDDMLNIDTFVYQIYENLESKLLLEISKKLPDLYIHMSDPRLIFLLLVKHLENGELVSYYIGIGLFYLITRYNVEYDDFYLAFYNIINVQIVEEFKTKFLSFIKIILVHETVSLHIIKSYIKKLARISLNVSTMDSICILELIFYLMKKHPSCRNMLFATSHNDKIQSTSIDFHNFQPYLYEFDVLEQGIKQIRQLVMQMRNEF